MSDHAWLPVDQVNAWLQLDPGDPQTAAAELCRVAAADHCERQRPDLFAPVDGVLPPVGDRIVFAGVLAAARLYARRSSPAGLASFGEFGAAEVLRLDPDVSKLLGVGRYAPPVVG